MSNMQRAIPEPMKMKLSRYFISKGNVFIERLGTETPRNKEWVQPQNLLSEK